jgi:hypothetical protein
MDLHPCECAQPDRDRRAGFRVPLRGPGMTEGTDTAGMTEGTGHGAASARFKITLKDLLSFLASGHADNGSAG